MKIRIFALFVILLLTSISAQKRNWEKTIKINTIEAYIEFINKYPQSTFLNEAKDSLLNLEYIFALNTNSISKFEQFNTKYPNSIFTDKVKKHIENLEYSNAIKSNTISSYQFFINKYPWSDENESLKDSILKLNYLKVINENNLINYNVFLQTYPNTKYSNQIREKISLIQCDSLDFLIDKEDIEHLSKFLNTIPNLNDTPIVKRRAWSFFNAKSVDALKLLLEHGGDINFTNGTNQNCLIFFIDNFELFKYAVNYGANINNLENKNGVSVLQWALFNKKDTIANYLLNINDIKLNVKNNFDKDEVTLADNYTLKKRIILHKNFNIKELDLSSIMESVYDQKDYDFAKYIFKKQGCKTIRQIPNSIKLNADAFAKMFNTDKSKINIIGYGASMGSNWFEGLLLINNYYYLGSLNTSNDINVFEIEKGTIIAK